MIKKIHTVGSTEVFGHINQCTIRIDCSSIINRKEGIIDQLLFPNGRG